MIKYHNLILIGSSHIAKQSVEEVRKTIEREKPKIIALELDHARLQALLSPQSKRSAIAIIKKFGIKGWLFNSLGSYAEKTLGKYTEIKPGSEMRTALEFAKKEKIKIALIDQPIEITIKKLTKQITRKEKLKFLKDILSIPFTKKKIKFDIRTVPSQKLIDKIVNEVKIKYPTVYKILIEERDMILAKQLKKIMEQEKGTILAVIGAGHIKGVLRNIHG